MTTSYIYVYYYKRAEAPTRGKVVCGNAPDRLRFLFLIIGEEYEYIE